MNASFGKRLWAFLIDFIFIVAILMLLSNFIPKDSQIKVLNDDINKLTEQVLNNEITVRYYVKEYSSYITEIDSKNVLFNTISLIITVIYFVIIPVFTKKTLGKHIMHLEIKRKDDKKLSIVNTFLRSIISSALLYSIITLLLVIFGSPISYLYFVIILGIIQFILVIISAFMILYRKDNQGLQDILSNSNVVLKEVK